MAVDGNRVTCDSCGVVLEVPGELLASGKAGPDASSVEQFAQEQGWTSNWEGQEAGDRCFRCSPPPDRKEIGVSTPPQ